MSLSTLRSAVPATPRRALAALAAAMLFWALAATLLFLLAPGLETWPRLLLLAECVGLTMGACVLLLARVPRLARLAPASRWLVLGLIAIPTGYFVGHQIAFLLLGEPMRIVGHDHLSLVPIVFTVLVGGLALHAHATREQLAREAAARAEAQRLAVESQLRLLRAQLEPHMLFNTLANLRSLLREDTARAEAMIDQLIVYLRSALAASQTEAVTLGREFAQLRAYLDIMTLRMGPRLTWQLDLPAALEAATVPPMLLQPLVENAIKHGLEPKIGPGRIEVVARATAAGIEIRVSDSGLGLPPDEIEAEPKARASYGLQHIRDRLLAVYGPAARLSLERREPAGVCAVVFIPR
ncbi:Autolysin sensor kinase [Rubrivivax sp. A210]|uniref:sensor histidine kinase n=1 Tax=Rubrivivax sp. A210 TaxID=2772301 RepID=UPI00191B1283|nr:histidine kinase [Rubrivivax sp. A210]CAD5371423.1 Autolysin sensor kinase [Rubrivivax sp. A210]